MFGMRSHTDTVGLIRIIRPNGTEACSPRVVSVCHTVRGWRAGARAPLAQALPCRRFRGFPHPLAHILPLARSTSEPNRHGPRVVRKTEVK